MPSNGAAGQESSTWHHVQVLLPLRSPCDCVLVVQLLRLYQICDASSVSDVSPAGAAL
jgi:hypothetical protein